jgi:hypothetical protein
MAMTMEEFVKRTNAEVVAGNVIVGELASRAIVGRMENGSFNLTADGLLILEALEKNEADAAQKRVPKKKASDSAGKTAADLAE